MVDAFVIAYVCCLFAQVLSTGENLRDHFGTLGVKLLITFLYIINFYRQERQYTPHVENVTSRKQAAAVTSWWYL